MAEATINGIPFPEAFIYKQAPPNSSVGEKEEYSEQYSNTNSVGQGTSKSFTQGFGLEEKFGGSFFWQSVQYDMKQNWSYTWASSYQKTVTNTNTQTGTVVITGPPCPALFLPCIPAYTEPHQFALYQDNLYGSFMFWPNPYFSFTVSPATQTVMPGGSTSYTIPTAANAGYSGTLTSFNVTGLPGGASAVFTPPSGAAGVSSTLLVSTSFSTPPGTYPLTISATDGSLTYYGCPSACSSTSQPYATLVVSATPGFSLSATPDSETIGIGGVTSYTVTVNGTNGFNGAVDLSISGLPPYSSASFSSRTITGSGPSTLSLSTANSIAPGTYPLTITATSGSLAQTTTVTLVVTGANFTLTVVPQFEGIRRGGTATYTVSTVVLNGFNDVVDLSIAGLPSGASATFNPTSIVGEGSSTLTITTTTSLPPGDYNLVVTGTSGAVTQSVPITLEVS